jgi:hypothetical protein
MVCLLQALDSIGLSIFQLRLGFSAMEYQLFCTIVKERIEARGIP